MKTKLSILGIVALFLIIVCSVLVSCEKDKAGGNVTYKGQVVYVKTTTPFPDLEVRLTDGNNVNSTTKTNSEGRFSINVDISTINDKYYFLIGDASCLPKKIDIPGWGRSEFDLGVIEVQGPSTPMVETNNILSIGMTSATFQGTVTWDGGYAVTARGFCYAKTDYPTIDNAHTTNGKGAGEFRASALELEVNTTYYVCAYATNEMGTAYGKSIKFTTSDGSPIVETTDPCENITETSIGAGGNVVDDFGYPVTARGVVYSTLPYPALENASVVESGSGKGYFSANITDVTPASKTYYIRAYATNSNGTSYGEQIAITPERSQYLTLPVVEYGGYRYHVYKDMGSMDWNSAMQLCDDLTFAGYDDWFLPDQYELQAIGEAKIRGWLTTYFDGSYRAPYWSSSFGWSEGCYCYFHSYIYIATNTPADLDAQGWYQGTRSDDYHLPNGTGRVRPVRKDKIQ